MSDNIRTQALASLKAMQTEITAIRYYNKKLASIKKDIDETTLNAEDYQTGRAESVKNDRNKFFTAQKKPAVKTNPFDVVLWTVFAVFSFALMLILHPGEKVNLLGGVVNWILHTCFVLYPLFVAIRLTLPSLKAKYAKLNNGAKIALFAVYALSVIAFVITVIFRPIFLICALPLVFGAVVLWLKSKENKKIAAESYDNKMKNARAKYAKMLREAEEADLAESARYEADLEKVKKEKEKKLASVIKECSAALSKHKANFKEVCVIPSELMQRDMGVVDALIAIIEAGKASSIDEAIYVYESERQEPEGEIRVYVGIRRREGWTGIRNLVYLDGERCCSAEMPYSVIKVAPGVHTVSAKVQLNYGGESHYPVSDNVSVNISGGDVKYIKFFVKGTPTVKSVVCADEAEFNSEL